MVWENAVVINRKKTSSVLFTTPPYVLRCQNVRNIKTFTIFLNADKLDGDPYPTIKA